MKKFFSFLLLLSLLVSIAKADDIFYLENKLSVEIKDRKVGSLQEWNSLISSNLITLGNISLSSFTEWKGYKGGIPVSEYEFYKIAGLENTCKNIEKQKGSKELYRNLSILGFAGSLLYGIGHQGSTIDENRLQWGLCGAISLASLWYVFQFNNEINSNITPASYALEVAESYNTKLKTRN